MKRRPSAKKDEESCEFLHRPLARPLKEKHLRDHTRVLTMMKEKRREYLSFVKLSEQQEKTSQKQLEKSLSHTRLRRQLMDKVKVKSYVSVVNPPIEPESFLPKTAHKTFFLTWHTIDLEIYGPKARESATLSALNGLLYLIGGQGMGILNTIASINPDHAYWENLPLHGTTIPLTYGHSAHIYKNSVVMYGGASGFSELTGKSVCQTSVRAFDCIERRLRGVYTEGGALEARKYHATALYGDSLIVHGGINDRAVTLGDLVVLDLLTCRWTRVEVTGTALGGLYGHTASTYKINSHTSLFTDQLSSDKSGVYVFGGRNKEASANLYWLKPKSRSLHCKKLRPFGRAPSKRYFHSAHVLSSGFLLIYGGTNNRGGFGMNEVHVLNFEKMFWEQVKVRGEPLPCLYAHAATTDNENVYIFGGCYKGKFAKARLIKIETNQRKMRQYFLNKTQDLSELYLS